MNKCDVTSNYSPWAGTIIGIWRRKLIVKSFALLGPLGLCTSSKKNKNAKSHTRSHVLDLKERKKKGRKQFLLCFYTTRSIIRLILFFIFKKMKKRKTLLIPEIRQAICLIRKSHIAQIPVVPYERSGSVLGSHSSMFRFRPRDSDTRGLLLTWLMDPTTVRDTTLL